MTWHPWRVLRSLAHLTIDTDADLPRGRAGDIHGDHIRPRRRLTRRIRHRIGDTGGDLGELRAEVADQLP